MENLDLGAKLGWNVVAEMNVKWSQNKAKIEWKWIKMNQISKFGYFIA